MREEREVRRRREEGERGKRPAAPETALRAKVTSEESLDLLSQLSAIEAKGGDGTLQLSRTRALEVTSLDRIYFPEDRRTKGDVMQYYVIAATSILPVIADRPLILKRHPQGIGGNAFYQHDAPDDVPEGVRVEEVATEGSTARRFIGGDLATLLYCAQLGSLAVNPWLSRVQSLETPDYAVLDLDPGPDATFGSVSRVAGWLKELLDDMSLSAGAKTSGSRGMHIYIPLPEGTPYASSQMLAESLAEEVADRHPEHATTKRSKSARPNEAIYVDAMQNSAGKSVAAAFSVRARPGATVSTPIAWEEVTRDFDPDMFNVDTIVGDLLERGRFWIDTMRRRNRLGAPNALDR